MSKIKFPNNPYEGQVYYSPEDERTYMYAQRQWVDITYEDVAKEEF